MFLILVLAGEDYFFENQSPQLPCCPLVELPSSLGQQAKDLEEQFNTNKKKPCVFAFHLHNNIRSHAQLNVYCFNHWANKDPIEPSLFRGQFPHFLVSPPSSSICRSHQKMAVLHNIWHKHHLTDTIKMLWSSPLERSIEIKMRTMETMGLTVQSITQHIDENAGLSYKAIFGWASLPVLQPHKIAWIIHLGSMTP